MDYENLLETLEIENGHGIEYFEHYAHIMESDEEIDQDALFELFKICDKKTLRELNENYFDELLRIVPDEEVELYVHLENIKRHIEGLIFSEDDRAVMDLAEAVYAFREWFSVDEQFSYKEEENWVNKSLRDVLAQMLLDKINGEDRHYDFNSFEEFYMDDYFVDLASLSDDFYIDEEEERLEI